MHGDTQSGDTPVIKRPRVEFRSVRDVVEAIVNRSCVACADSEFHTQSFGKG